MAEPAPTTNEPTIEADPEVNRLLATLANHLYHVLTALSSSLPTTPTLPWAMTFRVPPNVKFEVDDCEEPWTFREKFDLIHIRYLAAAIADWPKLMSQAFEFTKPGGYSEFQDYDIVFYSEDGTLTDDRELSSDTMQTTSNGMTVPIQKWITTFLQAARDFGRDPCPGPRLGGLMRDAGFQNVQEHKYKVPIGPWPKDKHLKTIGAWNLVQIENGLEGFTLRLFTQTLGWKSEEVHVLLANVRKDLRNPKIHAQFDFYVAYGQKPADAA
ncbi:MAG: hypothetical protein L6R42_001503 [Xanthoria sp. 1 TBL-2021]|nr:MAG: hypothetical protein L6R42_001503 [Xanthoria sp. 1 TBL-2021]